MVNLTKFVLVTLYLKIENPGDTCIFTLNNALYYHIFF